MNNQPNNTPLTPEEIMAKNSALHHYPTFILSNGKDANLHNREVFELGWKTGDIVSKSQIAQFEREKKTAIELLRINFYSENSDLNWTERMSEWQSYCKVHNITSPPTDTPPLP